MLVAHAHKNFFLDMKSIDALRSIFIRLGDKNTTRAEQKHSRKNQQFLRQFFCLYWDSNPSELFSNVVITNLGVKGSNPNLGKKKFKSLKITIFSTVTKVLLDVQASVDYTNRKWLNSSIKR